MEDRDLIAELAGGKAVADINRGFVSHNVVKLTVDLRLRYGIQGRSGLVQHKNRRFLIKSPCHPKLLLFAAGEIHGLSPDPSSQKGVLL